LKGRIKGGKGVGRRSYLYSGGTDVQAEGRGMSSKRSHSGVTSAKTGKEPVNTPRTAHREQPRQIRKNCGKCLSVQKGNGGTRKKKGKNDHAPKPSPLSWEQRGDFQIKRERSRSFMTIPKPERAAGGAKRKGKRREKKNFQPQVGFNVVSPTSGKKN